MTKRLSYFFLVVFILSFTYLNLRGISHYSDDLVFSVEAHTPDKLQWLINRYNGWSSRTAIEFALLSVINHKMAWAVCNAFFMAIMLCSLSYITAKNKKEIIIGGCIFLLILLITIKKGFIKDGMLWMTGSINYLWPLSLSFAGFSLLKYCCSTRHSTICSLAIPIFFFLSSFSEQLVVINLILLTAIALIFLRNVRRVALLSLAATSLVFAYIILSPGNANRYLLEIPRWYPDFVNFNIIDKVVLGINLSFDQMFSVQPLALIIIYSSLAFLNENKKMKLLALLIFIATICLLLLQLKAFSFVHFNTIYKFNSSNISGFFALSRVAIVLLFATLTTVMIYFSTKERKEAALISIVYISSYAGTVMLGLSPTIYASGQRTLFVSGIMISALATNLAVKSIRKIYTKNYSIINNEIS
ncbi:DUF6056 family protein [Sodalis ligni]|uniref:Uncharacterized protein n=1 Tax=Sodalis ligni TaxID=2697027 RepID=A0A4R1NFM0_9GAMM|nr:DUF6056 family protein [Sodalis ligni]TCL05719.1 hypothetical protein EZJ58_3934 [Sodalis ligni]